MKINELPNIQGPAKVIARLVEEYGDVTIDCQSQGFTVHAGEGEMQFLLVPNSSTIRKIDPNTQEGSLKTEVASYYDGKGTAYIVMIRRNASVLAVCMLAVEGAAKALEAAGFTAEQPARAVAA